MTTWCVLVLASASQAGVLMSGGLTAMPLAPVGIVPAWRLGVNRGGRTTVWVSGTWGSLSGAVDYGDGPEEELSGYVVIPQIGFRRDLAERVVDGVVPFVSGGVSVAVGGYKVNGEKPDLGTVEGPVIPPIGLTAGMGLDAPISEALSVSGELGLDLHTTRLPLDGGVFQGTALLTYGAIHFNIWL